MPQPRFARAFIRSIRTSQLRELLFIVISGFPKDKETSIEIEKLRLLQRNVQTTKETIINGKPSVCSLKWTFYWKKQGIS